MTALRAPDLLTPAEFEAASVALSLHKCFPFGATCKPAGFGMFTHPSNPRSMVYPLCRSCAAGYADPKQRQAFAGAMHRRFVTLGEVRP